MIVAAAAPSTSSAAAKRPSGGPAIQNTDIVIQRLERADSVTTAARIYKEAKAASTATAFLNPAVLAAFARNLPPAGQPVPSGDLEELQVGLGRHAH